MKSFLSIMLCGITFMLYGQFLPSAINKINAGRFQPDSKTLRFTQEFLQARQQLQSRAGRGGARAVTSVPIGTAGNLYTILNGNVNRVAANSSLNTVVFIHRANDMLHTTTNRGQYMYDVSYDRGMTWGIDYGVLNPSGNQQTLAGRYPNVVIYNPQGNTIPDNAYLAYLGTWLPFDLGGTWDGLFTGVARLNNDTSTFTEHILSPYNSDISIATGLCNGARGVFWSVNWGTEPYSSTTENIKNILIFKGVWNQSRNDADWVLKDSIFPPYDKSFNGLVQSGFSDIAFDPTGQFGWIGMLADCVPDGFNSIQPVFYSTRDGGATWSGPILVDLASLNSVMERIPSTAIFPTTTGDMDLVVDINGNPHMIAVIGGAPSDTTILYAGLGIYDITYNPAYRPECRWQAIWLDSLLTISGNIAIDDQGLNVTEGNRPQASLSPDGKKVFAAWLDSDPAATPDRSNSVPDYFTRAIDVTTGLATPTVNWTIGDNRWEGQALFASTAPTTLGTSGTYYIPTVFTEIAISTLATDPASFHYIQNISYGDNDFTEDVFPPIISLNGTSPKTVVVGTPYVDAGATATDNADGNLTGSITVNNPVNTNVPGTYYVTYSVTDAAGNVACEVSRLVRVVQNADVTPPVISLIGPSSISIDVCDFFDDPGATATDNLDGNITDNIVVTDNLPDPLVPGTYTISYNVTDGSNNMAATVTRTVVVSDQPPAIILIGGSVINVEICNDFVDPQGYGDDKCSGILPLTISGTVDENTVGSYILTYSASDGVNPPVTATRTVNITPDITPPTIQLLGPNPQYVYLGDLYNDPGAEAFDCIDDTLTSNVVSNASSAVNTSVRNDNYTVTYTVADANNNTATVTRTVRVNTEPDPRITYEISGGTVKFYNDSTLYASVLYNPEWKWEFGDGFISAQPDPSHTYAANGTYNVCLEAKNLYNKPPFNKPARKTCEDITITAVGIGETDFEKSISIYPNPTSGLFTVKLNGSFDEVTLSLWDIVGKEISRIYYGRSTDGEYILNLLNNPEGVYFAKIQTEQGTAVKRVIIGR